jgi:folylpolyglutamate synthase/dihydropteroate synthase
MADKDVGGIIAALAAARSLGGATVICTTLPVARAMPAGELAVHWIAGLPGARVIVESEPAAALDRALARSSSGPGSIVVAGSLYLVGAARALLVDDPDLRDP